jgi:hypothetical protein
MIFISKYTKLLYLFYYSRHLKKLMQHLMLFIYLLDITKSLDIYQGMVNFYHQLNPYIILIYYILYLPSLKSED